MDIRLLPSRLSGHINATASKSDVHRLLICSALSVSDTELIVPQRSADIDATVRCLTALGAGITYADGGFVIEPITAKRGRNREPMLDCGESGSTLRFLLPVAAVCGRRAWFVGSGRLPERPIDDLITAMETVGVTFSDRRLPMQIGGRMTAGELVLPGNVSSQYISGLLMALPKVEGNSRIRLTSALESSPYVDMTISALDRFGVEIEPLPDGWAIEGGQIYEARDVLVAEGDWSNAAFFLAAGALGKPVTVGGLNMRSPQGDRAIVSILERFGARVYVTDSNVTVEPGELHGCSVKLKMIPDLLPIMAVVAAFSQGETIFTGATRLKLKESDRLNSVAQMIIDLGGAVTELTDGLVVHGQPLVGGKVDSCGDHRIAMAAAIAACFCADRVTIAGAQVVAKSYPRFFEDFRALGGIYDVI